MATPSRARLSREERRQEIICAARKVFLESGLQGARTREIARVAGINEALIYQHFDSKDDLFDAAVVFPLKQIVDRLYVDARDLPPGTEELQRELTLGYIRNLLEALVESVSLLGVVLFSDRETGTVFYRSRIAVMLDSVTEVVRSNLASWSHREFDPEVITPALFGMCWGLAMDAMFRGREPDIDAVAETLASLIYEGLGLSEAPRGP